MPGNSSSSRPGFNRAREHPAHRYLWLPLHEVGNYEGREAMSELVSPNLSSIESIVAQSAIFSYNFKQKEVFLTNQENEDATRS